MAEKQITLLGKVTVTPRGAWASDMSYERLDIVEHLGSSFISLTSSNQAPLTDLTHWMTIARKGEPGAAFTFDDFTADQLARLKGDKGEPFVYADFTAEQIASLQQPATTAAEVALSAAAVAKRVPKIQNGTFWIYDPEREEYVDTGSSATGKSPKIVDGIWWEFDDEVGDYVSTDIPVHSPYELSKQKVEEVLTGDIVSHNHATELAEALSKYVRIVEGKQLSTEDFTSALKAKLTSLSNYDDAALVASIEAINQRISTLLGPSASDAIDTFQEIEAFLSGITDSATLTGLLATLKAELTALLPTKLSQLANDNHTVQDAAYVHTDTNFTAGEKAKLSGIAANANLYSHPAYPAKGSGLYKVTVDATGHISAAVPVSKADITALGIPAQDTNTTYAVASQSANGLMSAADKQKMDSIRSYATASTVTNINASYEVVFITLGANASLSLSAAGASYNGRTITLFVYCPSAQTITIPTTGNYISMCGSSYTCPAGRWVEFNLTCVDAKWHIAKLEQS